jgi:hypothetical protein
VQGHEFPLEQAALGNRKKAAGSRQQKPTPIADCLPPIACLLRLLPAAHQTYPRVHGRAHTHPTVAARELAGRRKRGNGFALAGRERRIPRGTAVYRRPRPVRRGRVEQPTMESGGACTQRRTAERMRLRFAPPEDQRAGRPFAPRFSSDCANRHACGAPAGWRVRAVAGRRARWFAALPAGSRNESRKRQTKSASGRLSERESEAPTRTPNAAQRSHAPRDLRSRRARQSLSRFCARR